MLWISAQARNAYFPDVSATTTTSEPSLRAGPAQSRLAPRDLRCASKSRRHSSSHPECCAQRRWTRRRGDATACRSNDPRHCIARSLTGVGKCCKVVMRTVAPFKARKAARSERSAEMSRIGGDASNRDELTSMTTSAAPDDAISRCAPPRRTVASTMPHRRR